MSTQADKRVTAVRFLGAAGAVGAGFLLTMLIVLYLLTPNINPLRHYVSYYANGPYGMVFRTGFFIHGLGNLAIAIGFALAIVRSRSKNWGVILFGISALGIILSALFPSDPPGSLRTTAGIIHNTVAFAGFPIEGSALFFIANALKNTTAWSAFASITRVIAVAGILSLVLLFTAVVFQTAPGIAERAVFLIYFIWEILAGMRLATYKTTRLAKISSGP